MPNGAKRLLIVGATICMLHRGQQVRSWSLEAEDGGWDSSLQQGGGCDVCGKGRKSMS